MKTQSFTSLEPLESRIAPAAIIGVGGKTATFTDVDGDLVTVATTHGVLDASMFTFTAKNLGEQLVFLHLDTSFAGANLSITAKPQGVAGDGLVNVVEVSSPVDLGKVRIAGDLCSFEAGDIDATVPGLGALVVNSLGLLTHIENYAGSSVYAHQGAGRIIVQGDDYGISIGTDGSFGAVKIGGSLFGGDSATQGEVFANDHIGVFQLGGSLIGGNGAAGASLFAADIGKIAIGGSVRGFAQGTGSIETGKIGSLTIGGSVVGNFGNGSAYIRGTEVGSIVIHGDVLGGTGKNSGEIRANTSLGKLVIGGSVRGGGGDSSGQVYVGGPSLSAFIGGEIAGGSGPTSGRLDLEDSVGVLHIDGGVRGGSGENSGGVNVSGDAANAFIGGSVLGGSAMFSGAVSLLGNNGTLRIGGDIIGGSAFISGGVVCSSVQQVFVAGDIRGGGLSFNSPADLQHTGFLSGSRIASLTIGGSLVAGIDFSPFHDLKDSGEIVVEESIGKLLIKGGLVGNADTGALIAVGGAATGATIGKLNVNGSVEYASIVAGYDPFSANGNPDAQIGKVVIGGAFSSSNLAAGIDPGADFKYGTNDDKLFSNAPLGTGQIASIASIVIKGQFIGTPLVATDHFGIVAERIGKMRVGSTVFATQPGAVNISVGYAGDTTIHDLA